MTFPESFPDTLPDLTEAQRRRVNQSLLDKLGLVLSWGRRVLA